MPYLRLGVPLGLFLTLALAACGQSVSPPAVHEDLPWSAGNEADTLSALSLSSGVNSLSDQTPTFASSGWGPYERDSSNGEQYAGDGHPMTLNGTLYAKGLGVHAESRLVYNLRGSPTDCTFTSDVGVDDEVGARGSVVFRVLLDGEVKFSSGKMTGNTATKSVKVALGGARRLALVVGGAGDGIDYDHADWADAKITCGSVQTQPPGTLDSSSKLTPDTSVNVLAAALDTDGSVLTAGTRGGDFALVRSRPDGTTQTVTTDFGGNDKPEHVYVLPGGKIEVIGFIDVQGTPGGLTRNPLQFVAARYLPDLSLDASFGVAGKVTGPVNTPDLTFNTSLLQPDGKFVLGGDAKGAFTPTDPNPNDPDPTRSQRDLALLRLLPAGTPDANFGTAGLVVTDSFPSSNDEWYDDRTTTLALQSDGTLLVGGYYRGNSFTQTPTYPTQIVLRYGPSGAVDTTLGTSGRLLGIQSRFFSPVDVINVQDTPNLILGGQVYGFACTWGRYSAQGSAISAQRSVAGTFGDIDGTTSSLPGVKLAVQTDQKILMANCNVRDPSSTTTPSSLWAVVRSAPDGTVDTAFGQGGRIVINRSGDPSGKSAVSELLLQPDGKIVVVGGNYILRYWP